MLRHLHPSIWIKFLNNVSQKSAAMIHSKIHYGIGRQIKGCMEPFEMSWGLPRQFSCSLEAKNFEH